MKAQIFASHPTVPFATIAAKGPHELEEAVRQSLMQARRVFSVYGDTDRWQVVVWTGEKGRQPVEYAEASALLAEPEGGPGERWRAACTHAPADLYSWHALDLEGERSILCVCCTRCGTVLKGAAD